MQGKTMENTIDFEQIKQILIKKAKGFYYTEEAVEFACDAEDKLVIDAKTMDENTEYKVSLSQKNSKKNTPKSGTSQLQFNFSDLECKVKKESKTDAKTKETSVVKRKITTHYVPPDMLAIKMLFENFGEKVGGLEQLSDEEILKMKRDLLSELEENDEGK